jgi:hypothetical protein
MKRRLKNAFVGPRKRLIKPPSVSSSNPRIVLAFFYNFCGLAHLPSDEFSFDSRFLFSFRENTVFSIFVFTASSNLIFYRFHLIGGNFSVIDCILGNPHQNTNATEDAYKTLFVGRLDYSITEADLRKEMELSGPVKAVRPASHFLAFCHRSLIMMFS